MKRVALALLACTVWTSAALAMEEPTSAIRSDGRIRTAPYLPTAVLHIVSTGLQPVQIVLQEGEEVASFSALLVNTASKPEEMKAVHDWFLRWSGNSLMLQPLKSEPTSMLFVDTKAPDGTMRHYRIQLDTRDAGPTPDRDAYVAVNMTYPTVVAAEQRAEAAKRAGERARTAALAEQAAAVARLKNTPMLPSRNWHYLAQNINGKDTSCSQIGPERVAGISDDGMQTTLLFAPHAALPVPYILDQDGKESVVQHSQEEVPDGLVMTLHTVAPKILLRRGMRVCGFDNLGYDPVGHSPGTGTVSTDVVRELKQ